MNARTSFTLPPELSATEPIDLDGRLDGRLDGQRPGRSRDEVRLLVAASSSAAGRGESAGTRLRHARFRDLETYLSPGDLVVVNTSATLPAAVDGHRAVSRGDEHVVVHFSTSLDDGTWLVELRPPGPATGPLLDATPAERFALPDGAHLTLLEAYAGSRGAHTSRRLWRASVAVEGATGDRSVPAYLEHHGRPISYAYVPRRWPLSAYQTVFARRPGSAEMPSAGRPFTQQLVTELVAAGVAIAPITLHTGVSSLEEGEPPLPERFEVPPATAALVNATRHGGGRVVAVGTTVTRALETVARDDGEVTAGAGWTDLVLGPDRRARAVTGLITGWHAPGASHLQLLEAVAGAQLVGLAYAEAVRERYRWHEFGDSCLLLPKLPKLPKLPPRSTSAGRRGSSQRTTRWAWRSGSTSAA